MDESTRSKIRRYRQAGAMLDNVNAQILVLESEGKEIAKERGQLLHAIISEIGTDSPAVYAPPHGGEPIAVVHVSGTNYLTFSDGAKGKP